MDTYENRCYLTLTQALHLRMGGNPFGPAGTGKTESVKALGAQLGRFVLVFNCDESFDYSAMGRLFAGLCQVGRVIRDVFLFPCLLSSVFCLLPFVFASVGAPVSACVTSECMQVGAWGCFDEFNRLEERILSAVSQQILAIQKGLLDRQPKASGG